MLPIMGLAGTILLHKKVIVKQGMVIYIHNV